MTTLRRRLERLEAAAADRRPCGSCPGPLLPDPDEDERAAVASLALIDPEPLPWRAPERERCAECGRHKVMPEEAMLILRRLHELRRAEARA